MNITQQLANQYANFFRKAGRFRLKSYNQDIPEVEKTLDYLRIFGWDSNEITALMVPTPSRSTNITVFVKNWNTLDPIKKVSILNHEGKHIAQARAIGVQTWLWRYFTDKDLRYIYETQAFLRNIETRYMFGYTKAELTTYIKRIANKLKGSYFLDQKQVNNAYKYYKDYLNKLLNGHTGDAARFWAVFEKTKKRSILL